MKKLASDSINVSTVSSTIVAMTAIISIMVCCLAALGYNSKVTVAKERIEVTSTNSNLD